MIEEPTNKNLLGSNYFLCHIDRLPKVSFFVQKTQIPAINMSVSQIPGPMGLSLRVPGAKIQYTNVSCVFLVDEDLTNYLEVWNWTKDLARSNNYEQYRRAKATGNPYRPGASGLSTDISIALTNSSYRVQRQIKIMDAFPVSITELPLDSTEQDHTPVTATVEFEYFDFTVQNIG